MKILLTAPVTTTAKDLKVLYILILKELQNIATNSKNKSTVEQHIKLDNICIKRMEIYLYIYLYRYKIPLNGHLGSLKQLAAYQKEYGWLEDTKEGFIMYLADGGLYTVCIYYCFNFELTASKTTFPKCTGNTWKEINKCQYNYY